MLPYKMVVKEKEVIKHLLIITPFIDFFLNQQFIMQGVIVVATTSHKD